MKKTSDIKEQYFMEDAREGERLERKVNADEFVDKYLRNHVDDLSSATILEAGCGPGAFLRVLGGNYPNHTITGIDISEARIAQATKKLSGLDNAKAIQANIYNLPFPDNHFDFIYSRFLFEYLRDPILAAKELYRVCKRGGKILLQDLDSQFTFYPEISTQLQDVLNTLKQRTGFDPDIGRKLFFIGRAAGFSFLHVETEMYHKVFGKIDEFNYGLWSLKLDIAFSNIRSMTSDNIEALKTEMLESLQSDSTVMFSTLFTLIFKK
jgi:ubiquinone/menaquinone biosynthesis C-methylase UbiE